MIAWKRLTKRWTSSTTSLTREVAAEEMPVTIAAQVTLLARFYERLGDHAVNLARRIELLAESHP